MKEKKNEIILFENQGVKLEVNLKDETVWLNRQQLSELFNRDIKTIGKHINNALNEELKDDNSVVAKFATTATDGKVYNVEYYNLDVIISIGYRVKSENGIIFRRWANKILKDYMIKGYAINQKRLEYLEKTVKLIDIANRIDERLENNEAKEILKVIGEYSKALDLLDDYDHKTLKKINGNTDERKIEYSQCIDIINKLRFNEESTLFAVERDKVLEIPNGKVIKEDYVGKNIDNYDSMLVLSHFKGHPMGGYGGALKQLSIGCASSEGKAWIHSAGKTKDQDKLWDCVAEQNDFLEAMADSAKSVAEFFKGNIVYINVMCNMSVDCDCCSVAEDPCIKDIGILASLDPIAIDQACIDLVYNSKDPGRDHFVERVERQNGIHTIEAAAELGFGTREYELIDID